MLQRWNVLCLTLPDDEHVITKLPQRRLVPGGTSDIATKLWNPVARVYLRSDSTAAAMLVPKASVNEDDFSMPWEHDIWTSWQGRVMEAKAIAKFMHQTSDQ